MNDVMRAELFKLVRRPSAWVLLAVAVVLNQVFGYNLLVISALLGLRLLFVVFRSRDSFRS